MDGMTESATAASRPVVAPDQTSPVGGLERRGAEAHSRQLIC